MKRLGAWFGLLFCVCLTWLVFGVLWWAPLTFAEGLRLSGGDLPTPTGWVVAAAACGAPLAAAAVYTPVIGWVMLRPGRRRAWIVAGMAGIAALWAALALWAIAIPLQVCGFHWPDFPWQGNLSGASACRQPG